MRHSNFSCQSDAASKLIWVLDDALYKGNSPSHGFQDITVLLPKTPQPTSWKDTRPITLSNTVDRTMAQLQLHRCNRILQQTPPVHQFARAGKQANELLTTIRRMARMARDWFSLWILKIDIRKAFDTIKQTSVAAMVASKLQQTHPWEARAWLSIIHGTGLQIIPAPPASQQPIHIEQSNGVRQGSPDSPTLFALKAGQILENTLDAQRTPPLVQGDRAPPTKAGNSWTTPTCGPPAYPDYRGCTDLEQRLQQHGMQIQPDKTQFIQSHDAAQPSTIKLGKETIQARAPATPISVFNQPVSCQANESHLAAHLATKARMAFHKQGHILTSDAPILAKLKLIAMTVTTAALWGCASWPVHHTGEHRQYRVVARAMGLKRRPGESGVDHYQRQIRRARLAVFKNHQTRWSTHILQSIWKLHGHIARQEGAAPDNVAQATLQWRNLAWWKAKQAKPRGTRHAARYNPFLDVERYIVHTAGLSWQHTAKNRQAWAHLQTSFIHAHDVPWSTGKQLSVQNLHQTGPAQHNTHHKHSTDAHDTRRTAAQAKPHPEPTTHQTHNPQTPQERKKKKTAGERQGLESAACAVGRGQCVRSSAVTAEQQHKIRSQPLSFEKRAATQFKQPSALHLRSFSSLTLSNHGHPPQLCCGRAPCYAASPRHSRGDGQQRQRPRKKGGPVNKEMTNNFYAHIAKRGHDVGRMGMAETPTRAIPESRSPP